jgi:hypothetical protein
MCEDPKVAAAAAVAGGGVGAAAGLVGGLETAGVALLAGGVAGVGQLTVTLASAVDLPRPDATADAE